MEGYISPRVPSWEGPIRNFSVPSLLNKQPLTFTPGHAPKLWEEMSSPPGRVLTSRTCPHHAGESLIVTFAARPAQIWSLRQHQWVLL